MSLVVRRIVAACFVASSSLALAACGGPGAGAPPVLASASLVARGDASIEAVAITGQRGRRGEPIGYGPATHATTAPSATPVATATPTTSPTVTPTVTPTTSPTPAPGGAQPASAHAQPPPAGWVPFASAFAQRAPSAPTVDAQSASYVRNLVGTAPTSLGTIQVAHDASGIEEDYTVPWYTAMPTDATYTIHCIYSAQWGKCGLEGKTIPIPAYAQPENGFAQLVQDNAHDEHLAIHDPVAHQWYDMWLAPRPSGNGGTMTIGYGGAVPDNGNGYENSATASGFELTQGIVRPVELLAGSIEHALFITTPCENGHIAPATGDDGQPFVVGCPPIGAHVWLDSTPTEIAASGATPYAQMFMLALHNYGAYIGDRAGGDHLGIALENDLTYTQMGWPSQWAQVAQKFGFPYYASGDRGTYHVPLTSGSIDLSSHLHVID